MKIAALPIGTIARTLEGHLLAIEVGYKREHITAALAWMSRLRQAIAGDQFLTIVGPFSALDQHLEDSYEINAKWILKYERLSAEVRRMLQFFTQGGV